MNAISQLYGSPLALATLFVLAVLAIGYARWATGPAIWRFFARAAREDLAFLRAAAAPWTWPRRWRKRRS